MKKQVAPRSSAKPFLRFHHSKDLRARTNAVLRAIEHDEDSTPHADRLAAVVVELTEAGLAYFFRAPLKAAKVGMLLEQSAGFGLSSTVALMSPVIRSVICRMDHQQLLVVAAHLRQFMR